MKRRRFIEKGTTGALGLGLAGCSAFRNKKFEINKPEQTPINFDKKIPLTGVAPSSCAASTRLAGMARNPVASVIAASGA